MTREEIFEQIQSVFQSVFNDDDITISEEMTADDYEAWDSLSHIQLIIAVEKHFSQRFSNAEVARLADVGDLIKLVESKTSAAA